MQLGQPQPFRILDDHDAGIGYVNPHFNNGGGHQNLQLTLLEPIHDVGLFGGLEPAMHQPDGHIRQEQLELLCGFFCCLAL